MEWSGQFVVLDSMTRTPVRVHVSGVLDTAGAFDPDELVEAVRVLAARHGGGALALSDAKDAIAHVAGERLGLPGRLSITAFSFDPTDMERLTVFAMRAAARAGRTPNPEQPKSDAPCAVCGAPGHDRFCPECGAPRARSAVRA
jgi:hypothetical protein